MVDKESKIKELLKLYGLTDIPLSQVKILTYKKGDVIRRQGEESSGVLLLLKGDVKVKILSGDEKSLFVAENKDKGIIGDMELVLNTPCSATVLALSDVEVMYLPTNSYRDILLSSPSFLRMIVEGLAKKLLISSYVGVRTAYFPLKKRLCSYISCNSKNKLFDDNLTEVAEKLGTSYRHLFRVLSELKDEGIIAKEKKGYAILNLDKLLAYTRDMEGESNF